jgi:hypothetical protein
MRVPSELVNAHAGRSSHLDCADPRLGTRHYCEGDVDELVCGMRSEGVVDCRLVKSVIGERLPHLV